MTLPWTSQNDVHRSLEISLENARFPHSHSASSFSQWTRTSEKRGHLKSVIYRLRPSVLTARGTDLRDGLKERDLADAELLGVRPGHTRRGAAERRDVHLLVTERWEVGSGGVLRGVSIERRADDKDLALREGCRSQRRHSVGASASRVRDSRQSEKAPLSQRSGVRLWGTELGGSVVSTSEWVLEHSSHPLPAALRRPASRDPLDATLNLQPDNHVPGSRS